MLEILDGLAATIAVVLVLSLIVQAIQQMIKQTFSLKTDYMKRELLALFSTFDRGNVSEWVSTALQSAMPGFLSRFMSSGTVSRVLTNAVRFIPQSIQPTALVGVNAGTLSREIVQELTERVRSFGYKDLELLENVDGEKFKKIVRSLPRYEGISAIDEASVKVIRDNVTALKQKSAQANSPDDKAKLNAELQTATRREEQLDELLTVLQDIDTWFDISKNAFQDHYERRMKLWSFALSGILVLLLNANLFEIYQEFSVTKPMRDAGLAITQKMLSLPRDSVTIRRTVGKAETTYVRADSIRVKEIQRYLSLVQTDLKDSTFQILRWNKLTPCSLWSGDCRVVWLARLFGWLSMTLLVSLGAPFWYDFLKSVMGVKEHFKKTSSPP